MIQDYQILREGHRVLIGIALGNAVLDFETEAPLIANCLRLLDDSGRGLVRPQIGSFGLYPVSLNIDDDQVSIFIDGPQFIEQRDECAAIYLDKDEFHKILIEAQLLLQQGGDEVRMK